MGKKKMIASLLFWTLFMNVSLLFVSCEKKEEREKKVSLTNTSKETSSPSIVDVVKKSVAKTMLGDSSKETTAPSIVKSARKQIGKTLFYDPKYVGLSYPNGDVPLSRGVCTDVVIRAMRDSMSIDLQKEVHEDMQKAFSTYPKIWGAKSTDKNIDHRRVPNLKNYFKRKGYALTVTKNPKDYRAGDIVTCKVQGRPHIMIVSSKQTSSGTPYVIHNIGLGTREDDSLFSYVLDGHYRVR